ncbi:hypothetical protein CMUS01_08814 [Colletotrichum musicola]|uniref:Uncharacterized protein n=1 Tax=Colletotrichum musicola TaxID=2175873 RepID=A0A8H6NCJ7_9PEZI|nr:hypothetical protein CMUS01_08814 [Colletotrichum musicola]
MDVARALGLDHAGLSRDGPTPGIPNRPSLEASISVAGSQEVPAGISHPVSRSLDVIARLWLTINFDTFPLEETYPRQTTVAWAAEHTLQQAVECHFVSGYQPAASPTHHRSIPSSFKMASLCDRYDFSIRWSNNLADHLEIVWNGNHGTVTIYEHVICLWNHLQYSSACPIPVEMLEETLDTIILLFPPDDRGTRKLLKRHDKTFWRLGRCGREWVSSAGDFHYWRARIDALLKEYEQPPRGARQLRLDEDGRNFLEFSTFWTALAVAVLTILGIGFGTLGTVYAIKAYNLSYKQYVLSQKQYMLDLVQACVETGARERWPHICSEAD